MLGAFAPANLLHHAFEHAVEGGYLGHELGDLSLLLPGIASRLPRLARAS